MKCTTRWRVPIGAMMFALVAACSTTPERIDVLETARTLVQQAASSPRAGIAATHVSAANDSLARANHLAAEEAKLEDIEFEAEIAALNARIALEKIQAAHLREYIDASSVERQAVLLKARERQVQAAQARAQAAQAGAQAAQVRANSLEDELQALRAQPTPRGMVLTLGDVLFETAEAELKAGAYRTIDRVAEALKREPERRVVIEGHTDSVGSDEYNQALSQRRANAVRNALLARGVSSEQVRAVGRGEHVPIASNKNPGGRQENRRVEMVFTGTGPQVATDTG